MVLLWVLTMNLRILLKATAVKFTKYSYYKWWPRTEATNWQLVSGWSAHTKSEYTLLKSKNRSHKLTATRYKLAVIKVKSWAQNVECSLLSADCWVLSAEFWVLSAECWARSAGYWVLSAECWVLVTTIYSCYRFTSISTASVVHILGQNLHWYSPKTEAIDWRLHCILY